MYNSVNRKHEFSVPVLASESEITQKHRILHLINELHIKINYRSKEATSRLCEEVSLVF